MKPQENNMSKFTIYLQGGGVAAGVTGGMLLALLTKVPKIFEKQILMQATSGASGSVFYALSSLHDEKMMNAVGYGIWTKSLADPNFVKKKNFLKTSPIMDVEYLTHHIFKQDNPLNEEKVFTPEIGFAFPAFDVDAGKTVWLTDNEGMESIRTSDEKILVEEISPYDTLRAVKSVPFLDNRFVTIFGRRLIDGVLDYPIPLSGESTDSRGILLLSRKRHISLSSRMEKAGTLLIVEPDTKIGSNSDISEKSLYSNFQAGFDAIVARLKHIQEFV